MSDKNFSTTILVDKTPTEVFNAINNLKFGEVIQLQEIPKN